MLISTISKRNSYEFYHYWLIHLICAFENRSHASNIIDLKYGKTSKTIILSQGQQILCCQRPRLYPLLTLIRLKFANQYNYWENKGIK
ncbi:hypothetical protein pb186bvf_021129, partial [Paramecium bursaria]